MSDDISPQAPDAEATTSDLPAEAAIRLAEAMIFAAADPVPTRAVAVLLPDQDAEAVIAAVRARHDGSGVRLEQVAGGWQFRTAPDLAPALTKVIAQPRRLSRVAMETLAIIAYHQPVTRGEIEEVRGASLSQSTLDALLETGLVTSRGHKEVPGRPALWGTTEAFLLQFGLKDLRDLPRREDLLVDPPAPAAPPQADPVSPGPEPC